MKRYLVPGVALAAVLVAASSAHAGKMGVLDELVRTAVRDARAELRTGVHVVAEDTQLLRGGEDLFESAAKRHEILVRAAGRIADLDEPALAKRLAALAPRVDSESARTLASMSLAERRFVVEAAETAASLSRKYPVQAKQMIRRLGPEGLSYTRSFGDDVAEVVLEEGSEALNVLRKGGRGAWSFFKEQVLPHKKKLAAAGLFAAFLANPDEFVDMAGRATDYAVREFARAGVELAGVLPGAVADGVHAGVAGVLDRWGLNYAPLRWAMALAALAVATGAVMRLAGLPLRAIAWPLTVTLRRFRRNEQEQP
jgi:hypothetical protein